MRTRFISPVPRAVFLAAVLITAVLVTSGMRPHAAEASGPAQFCYDVFLYAGGTQDASNTCVHGAAHSLTTVQAKSTGTAAVCVGGFTQGSVTAGDWSATYGGPSCGGAGGGFVYHNSYGDVEYPALHNHSTFQSRFEGLFYYNY